MEIFVKAAQREDWPALEIFYHKSYRKNHPLQDFDFWNWQYVDKEYGQAFIAITNTNEVVGHAGAQLTDGYAWMINVYLDERFRGKGVMRDLYNLARIYAPMVATSANSAGLGMYRNMKWFRYCDLQRYIAVNPVFKDANMHILVSPIEEPASFTKPSGSHYWRQPGITGIQLADGSTGVLQAHLGGIRFVEIADPATALQHAWEVGARWVDFVTSWNNLICVELEKCGWVHDRLSTIPWRLEPLIPNSHCEVSYLSEEPMPRDFIVQRYHSDHGRIGSIVK